MNRKKELKKISELIRLKAFETEICEYYEISDINNFKERQIKEISGLINKWINKIPVLFIKKYADILNWPLISQKINLTPEIIEALRDYLIQNNKFNVFVYKNPSFLNNKILKKFESYINYNMLLHNPALTEDFIEKHQEKFNWEEISKYFKMSTDFIFKHLDKLNLHFIIQKETNKEPSDRFCETALEKGIDLSVILSNQQVSDNFVRKHVLHSANPEKYISTLLFYQKNISEKLITEFIEKNMLTDKDFYILAEKHKMSENFWIKYSEKISSWGSFLENQPVYSDFLIKHKDKWIYNVIAAQSLFTRNDGYDKERLEIIKIFKYQILAALKSNRQLVPPEACLFFLKKEVNSVEDFTKLFIFFEFFLTEKNLSENIKNIVIKEIKENLLNEKEIKKFISEIINSNKPDNIKKYKISEFIQEYVNKYSPLLDIENSEGNLKKMLKSVYNKKEQKIKHLQL